MWFLRDQYMGWTLFKFQIRTLSFTWYRLPFLLTFIFLQMAFILAGAEQPPLQTWVTPIIVVLFSLIVTQSFHETLKEDFEDKSLFWLLSQRVDPALYFLSKCGAFCIMTLFPTLLVVISFWIFKGNSTLLISSLSLAMLFIGVQAIFLGGTLSLISLRAKLKGIHLSLPISLLPLNLPSLLLISSLDQGCAPSFALDALGGLTLIHMGLGIGLFRYVLKGIQR